MNALADLPDLLGTAHGSCTLPHLGLIHAQGAEAAHFLHNQLSNDFLLLPSDQARLAAFCNAKGRMQASFIGFKTSPEDVWLVVRQDLLAQTLKRLRMFVLRAKVVLQDVSHAYEVRGVLGAAVPAALAANPWSLHCEDAAWSVRLYPAQGHGRALHIVPMGTAPAEMVLPTHDWALSEILSGVADVQAATFEAFVPQMLNYESVEGVNFKKGCYPGQEVVARSQFRGTLKRRTYLATASAPTQAGEEVFTASDTTQPAGMVAQACHHPSHGDFLLVCLQNSVFQAPDLALHTALGAGLTLHALPYALRDDI
jgi:folate-binding protein YgfZ